MWGPEDLLGPKAPGMTGAVAILDKPFPSYDIFSIFIGPIVLGALWLLLTKTRWGLLVRAATQDREMVGALGVNQRWLFTSVFALGTFLAALGGALQMPHEPANLNLDLALIGEVFVVVVVGGMGIDRRRASWPPILIAMVKAFCIGAGTIDVFGAPFPLSKLTLVAEFVVMAIVLVFRPSGLLRQAAGGGALARRRSSRRSAGRCRPLAARRLDRLAALALVPLFAAQAPYAVVLLIDIFTAVLFAASLHFLMGPSGMHSFGHAAYFGLGAYGAALCFKGARPADGSLARARAAARRARRVRVRLVLRAPLGRLPGDAHARLRADRLVGRLPVGRAHRRQQRPGRHLAVGVARAEDRRTTYLTLAFTRARLRPARAHAARADRPGAARQPRLAAARRGDRHRRAAAAVDRLRRRRHGRGPRRLAVRLRQGHDLARDARRSASRSTAS